MKTKTKTKKTRAWLLIGEDRFCQPVYEVFRNISKKEILNCHCHNIRIKSLEFTRDEDRIFEFEARYGI